MFFPKLKQWAKKYNFGKSGGWKIEFPCKIYTPAYTYLCLRNK